MPLILAIEPDRRQASRVTALARETLGAELLVSDSSERGLAALGGRVPDLILTSRLLSPKDEAGLRALDRAGVPVPTLMIPVLAAASNARPEPSGGFLARMPWARHAVTLDCEGCDPQVFASQIAEYLSEVKEAPRVREALPPPVEVLAATVDLVAEPVDVLAEPALPEPPLEAIEAPVDLLAAEPASVVEAEIAEEPVIVEEAVMEMAAASIEWEDVELEEEEDAAIELTSEAIDLQAFVDELNATYADLFPRETPPAPVALAPEIPAAPAMALVVETAPEAPAEHRPALAHALPMFAAWPCLEGVAADETPLADITEIVADFAAALECVDDEPETSSLAVADSDMWMPLGTAPGVVWPRLDSTCSRERPRPAQDEWGFFDPEQCGFSALVAKLDQMTR